MGRLSAFISISELREDAAKVLKQVQASHVPLIITQRGRAVAVLLSLRSYEANEREKELLRL